MSLSCDFGDLTLGVAQSSQEILSASDAVFKRKARKNVAAAFECSQSSCRISNRETSLAAALDF
jgi:RNase H-fold protein (predicted Holliday junction resolvase)